MIEGMSLENFKGWQSMPETRFGKITGFFGSNSAGKSSLTQLLLMLKQTVESPDRNLTLNLGDDQDRRSLVVLGSFEELIYGHDLKRELGFSFSWHPKEPIRYLPADAETNKVARVMGLSARISASHGMARLTYLAYKVGRKPRTVAMHRDPLPASIEMVQQGREYKLNVDMESLGLKRVRGRKTDIYERPVRFYGFPERVRQDFQNPGLLLDIESALEQFFVSQLYYLGPLREQPQRAYSWTGGRPGDVGRSGENTIPALLASRKDGPIIEKKSGEKLTVEQAVAQALQKMGLILEYSLKEIANTSLYCLEVQTKNGSVVLLPDVGIGVSQVLPVLAICYYVPEQSTILLEHPELHLHPSIQASLADALIDACEVRDIQLVIESHSEHFLRRLQLRIAESRIDAEEVKLYFCKEGKDGSHLDSLSVNECGEIENWPSDFFGDLLGHALNTRQAAIEKLLKQKGKEGEV